MTTRKEKKSRQGARHHLNEPEAWGILPVPIPVAPMLEQALGLTSDRRYVAFYTNLRTFMFGYDDGEFHPAGSAAWKDFTSHPAVNSIFDPFMVGAWLLLDRETRMFRVGRPPKVRLFLDSNILEYHESPASFDDGQMGTAQQQLRNWMDAEFEKPAAQFRIGCWFEQDGQSAEALLAFQKAAECDADLASHPAFQSRLGAVCLGLRRYSDAVGSFQRVIESRPSDPDAQYSLALAFLGAERFGDAIAAFKRLTELQPNNVSGYSGLGLAFEMNKQHVEAIDALKLADRLQPDDPEIHSNLAAAYAATGDTKAAFREIRNAMDLGLDKDLERKLLKQL